MVKRTHMSVEELRWEEILRAEGFKGGGVRENVLARMLVKNEFSSLRQLRHAPNPAVWLHATDRPDELEFLGCLIARQKVCAQPQSAAA